MLVNVLTKMGIALLLLAGCSDEDGPFDFVVTDRSTELLNVHYASYADSIGATHVVRTGGVDITVTVGACQQYACVGRLIDETLVVEASDTTTARQIGMFCTGTEGYYGEAFDPQFSGACAP